MSDRDISTGKGFTNGLAPADIEYIKRAIVNAAVDAYRAGIRESIAAVEALDYDYATASDAEWVKREEATAALRALLDKP